MISKIGYSQLDDAYQAGVEAGAMAQIKGAKVVFAYASCNYDIAELLKGLKSQFKCPVIGNTSFTGVVLPEGFITGDKFVGVMALGGKDLEVGVGFADRKDFETAREAGVSACNQAMAKFKKYGKPNMMYMCASPTEEEFFLKGISSVIGRVPLFGGSAADNTIEGKWSLYANENVTGEGVAVAVMYTDAPFANKFTGAYRETKDMGIITEISGNRCLVKIDKKPALEKYASWRKMDVESLKGNALLSETIVSPLGVKDRLGDLVAIRHPMFGNDDCSMNIGANLAVGTAVIRMEASVDELIASVENTLNELKAKIGGEVECYHLVHCGGRRAGIADRIEEVYAGVKNAIGDTPFIMEFTFGEYGFEDDGRNTIGGLMLSFTAFGKK